jgi:hypothetical protein
MDKSSTAVVSVDVESDLSVLSVLWMDCLQGLTNTGSNLEYPVSNQEKDVASIQASVTSELSLQKNPLCKKGSSPLALILLQQRAEAVGENLAAIQSKIATGPRSAFDQGPVAPVSPNQQFANTVQAHHPSIVQDILGLQLTHSSSNLEGNSAATELSLQVEKSSVPVYFICEKCWLQSKILSYVT